MYHTPDRPRSFYAANVQDDKVQTKRGSGIPRGYGAAPDTVSAKRGVQIQLDQIIRPVQKHGVHIAVASLFFMVGLLGWQNFDMVGASAQVATPTILLQQPSGIEHELVYGSEPLLAEPNFFAQTHQALISEEATFITANLEAMRLDYYEDGDMVATYSIQSKGRPGSWWETPAGLYQIEDKRPSHRSSFAGVDLPWSMPFQGNFFIHGVPEHPDGTPVASSFSGGCIRLATPDAEELFSLVSVGTPVLVHAPAETTADTFQYEPSIPDMNAPHYMVADIGNNTILASSDLHEPAPIASITKLMTALVATEHINLDQRVPVQATNFVQSMVPRLADRRSVSMYSLLQLLLLESSNEAANLIADQMGRAEFVARMNDKAAAIGMQNTTFTDPSGRDAGNISTLSDLLRLTQYLHDNRDFVLQLTANQYVATAYDADAFGELNNFNLLSELDDFYGGKTGETSAAGRTSLSLHQFTVDDQKRMIAIVVLGSQNRTVDVLQLHSYFQERFVR